MPQNYQYFDLPKIDKHYLTKMRDVAHDRVNTLRQNPNAPTSVTYEYPFDREKISKLWANENEKRNIALNEALRPYPDTLEYLQDILSPYNIKDLDIYIIIFVNVHPNYKTAYTPAHVDSDRMWSLNYVIETGGNNVITSWHKKTSIDSPTDREFYGPDEVSRPIERVQFRQNEWHLFNASAPHSIENVENVRITLAMSSKESSGSLRERLPKKSFHDDI